MPQGAGTACTLFTTGSTARNKQAEFVRPESALLKSGAQSMLNDWQNQLNQQQCSAQRLLEIWGQEAGRDGTAARYTVAPQSCQNCTHVEPA